jgi:hypothetical protein
MKFYLSRIFSILADKARKKREENSRKSGRLWHNKRREKTEKGNHPAGRRVS